MNSYLLLGVLYSLEHEIDACVFEEQLIALDGFSLRILFNGSFI